MIAKGYRASFWSDKRVLKLTSQSQFCVAFKPGHFQQHRLDGPRKLPLFGTSRTPASQRRALFCFCFHVYCREKGSRGRGVKLASYVLLTLMCRDRRGLLMTCLMSLAKHLPCARPLSPRCVGLDKTGAPERPHSAHWGAGGKADGELS